MDYTAETPQTCRVVDAGTKPIKGNEQGAERGYATLMVCDEATGYEQQIDVSVAPWLYYLTEVLVQLANNSPDQQFLGFHIQTVHKDMRDNRSGEMQSVTFHNLLAIDEINRPVDYEERLIALGLAKTYVKSNGAKAVSVTAALSGLLDTTAQASADEEV